MSTTIGRLKWNSSRDSEGHRNYTVSHLVKTDDTQSGPNAVFNSPGLPVVGTPWSFGTDNDPWAICTPEAKARPAIDNELNVFWIVENMFTTRPQRRCQENSIENPVNEPPTISGSFARFTKEAAFDRHGNKLCYSNHQLIKGPAAEFDSNRPSVIIETNQLSLDLNALATAIDTVNDSFMWGLSARKIKLSNASWARRLYGTCNFYFNVRLEFEINGDTWDREVVDEGTVYLSDGGDATKPEDYIQYKDKRGNNQRILLDGQGGILQDGEAPFLLPIEYYDETNFLGMGVPGQLT